MLALFSAGAGVAVFLTVYALTAFLTGTFSIIVYLLSTVSIAMVIYLSVYILSNRIIFERLKHIYRTLYFLKPSTGMAGSGIPRENMLQRTEEQVDSWARDRKDELEKIRQLAEYRRDFLGNVSHELKTPIFNIQGYVMTLLDGGLDDPEINVEYLRRTERSIDRLITIVDDLEAIAKMEAGELQLKLERFDIVALTREVFEFLEIKAHKKKARMYFEGKYDRPLIVFADRERIREVLINLVDNSIKYRRKDTDSKIGIAFHDMDDHYLVEITDNGIGMPQQDISRVFERFYRTEEGRMRSHSGSGLGLAIVKHVIEAHDEKISVRSREKEGTTFGFTLRKVAR